MAYTFFGAELRYARKILYITLFFYYFLMFLSLFCRIRTKSKKDSNQSGIGRFISGPTQKNGIVWPVCFFGQSLRFLEEVISTFADLHSVAWRCTMPAYVNGEGILAPNQSPKTNYFTISSSFPLEQVNFFTSIIFKLKFFLKGLILCQCVPIIFQLFCPIMNTSNFL